MLRFSRLCLLAGIALMTSGACFAETVLRIRPYGDLQGLDPVVNTDNTIRNHGYMVYDTLFALDAGFMPRPQMVESWTTSPDDLTWTFRLRPGLRFHDGAPVTSADAVASLRRWAKRDGLGQLLLARMAELETVDADSFRLTLTRPWSLVLEALATPSSKTLFVMPARVAEAPADRAITDPTGSGPYVFRRDLWVAGARVVYDRNPAYVPRSEPADGLAGGKRAGFDRIEWHIIPDTQTAANALRTGEIDVFEEVPPDLLPLLRADKALRIAAQDTVGQQMLFRMNTLQKPFSNPKLRRAVGFAIDQATFIAAYTDDPALGHVCRSFFPCGSPYATEKGWPATDLARARALVAESGYDGTPVVLLDPPDKANTHAFTLVAAEMLRRIGLKTDVQVVDWASITARRASKEPVERKGWSVVIPGPGGLDLMDPLRSLPLRANCAAAWFGWPCDSEMERLRAAFADATDPVARRQATESLQLRTVEVAPYWPLGTLMVSRAYRADLDGFVKASVPVYWNITRH
jgi:peptide/nickel transport system substrate-binding protein